MLNCSDVIYVYDGTLSGLLCAIQKSMAQCEIPLEIVNQISTQMSFYPMKIIKTTQDGSRKMLQRLYPILGDMGWDMFCRGFDSFEEKKEMVLLHFAYLTLQEETKILSMLQNPTVHRLYAMVKHLENEAHLYKGFVRFSVYENHLIAIIEPKNFVLPYLADHFCDRYANESFLIYDKTHKTALIYQNGKRQFVSNLDYQLPEVDEEEMKYRSLWSTFYQTIGIRERYNPRCRMNHMPKRYWQQMTEMNASFTKAHPHSFKLDKLKP